MSESIATSRSALTSLNILKAVIFGISHPSELCLLPVCRPYTPSLVACQRPFLTMSLAYEMSGAARGRPSEKGAEARGASEAAAEAAGAGHAC
jgi:hypothetical protein